jgi:hypothetical protein
MLQTLERVVSFVTRKETDPRELAEQEIVILLGHLDTLADSLAPGIRQANEVKARIVELSVMWDIKLDLGKGVGVAPVFPTAERVSFNKKSLMALLENDPENYGWLEDHLVIRPPQSDFARVKPDYTKPPALVD